MDVIQAVYGDAQVRYLVALAIANLLLATAVALVKGQFRLTRLADWLVQHILPAVVGYGAAALLSVAQPELAPLRTVAFATLSLTMVGYILSACQDLGIPIPDALAAKMEQPQLVQVVQSDEPVPVAAPVAVQK